MQEQKEPERGEKKKEEVDEREKKTRTANRRTVSTHRNKKESVTREKNPCILSGQEQFQSQSLKETGKKREKKYRFTVIY